MGLGRDWGWFEKEERWRRVEKEGVVVGSKEERVKKRRERKTRRAQIEMVDWALERRRGYDEAAAERRVSGGEGGGVLLWMVDLKELEMVVLLILSMGEEDCSCSLSGKKTRKKPSPQLSLLLLLSLLPFAVNPIDDLSLSL